MAPEHAYPAPTLAPHLQRDSAVVSPAEIAGSAATHRFWDPAVCVGYELLDEAVDAIVQRISNSRTPTYTHWYVPHVDTAAHEHGAWHGETRAALRHVDGALEALARRLDGLDVRFVVSADHGHLDAPAEGRWALRPDDPLLEHLRALPSGDARVTYFHLRPGQERVFREAFTSRFGERFVLLTAGELEALELLGSGQLSPETRRRVGNLVALSLGADVLLPVRAGDERPMKIASHHGGLTPAEMRVPLVLWP